MGTREDKNNRVQAQLLLHTNHAQRGVFDNQRKTGTIF